MSASFPQALELAQRVNDFTKYARFVSDTLDVPVRFGEAKPGMDHEGVRLPDLLALDARSIDFLYATLLREAGGFKHTKLDAAGAALLTSEGLARLAGAIECARVERALSREFDGAPAILARIHNEFSRDPRFAPLALGFDPKGAWASDALALATRRALSNVEGPEAKEILGARLARKAQAFLASAPAKALLTGARPKSFPESIQLARALWALWLNGARDTTPALDLPSQTRAAQSIERALGAELTEACAPDAKRITELETKLREARAAAKATNEAQERELAAARAISSSVSSQAQALMDAGQAARELGQSASSAQKALQRQSSAESRQRELQARVSGAQAKAQESKSLGQSAKRQESAQKALSEAQALLTRQLARLEKAREAARKALADFNAQRVEAQNALLEAGAQPRLDAAERAALAQAQAMAQRLNEAIQGAQTLAGAGALTPAETSAPRDASADTEGETDTDTGTAEPGIQKEGELASEGAQQARAESPEASAQSARAQQALAPFMPALHEAVSGMQSGASACALREAKARADAASQLIKDSLRAAQGINATLSEARDKQAAKQIQALERADAAARAAGLPGILPDFIPTPGWEIADEVQKEFDARLSAANKSAFVRNGAGLGPGGRSLDVLIESGRAAALDIDFAQKASAACSLSKIAGLSELGDDSDQGSESGPSRSRRSVSPARAHRPSTTAFDSIQIRATCKDPKALAAIRARLGAQSRRLSAIFRKRLKFGTRARYRGGKEDGELDARALWKLASGLDSNFMEINDPKPMSKCSAVILTDISGSQDKPGRAERMRELVWLLSEALGAAAVNHEILAAHAPVSHAMREAGASALYNRRSNSLETLVLKRFTDRSNGGLTHIEPQVSDNSDGESVRVALSRLSRQGTPRKLLLVVSDALPHLSDGDDAMLDEDLRSALRDAARAKCEVFHFSFEPGPERIYGKRHCAISGWEDLERFADACMG